MKVGTLNYDIYRDDYSPQYLGVFTGTASDKQPVDIVATYSDVSIQIREQKNPESRLLKAVSILEETITVSDSNTLLWDFKLEEPSGVYYYDIRFNLKDTDRWITYLQGFVRVTNNVTEV